MQLTRLVSSMYIVAVSKNWVLQDKSKLGHSLSSVEIVQNRINISHYQIGLLNDHRSSPFVQIKSELYSCISTTSVE